MNTGIQDAFNLSWKLASVIRVWPNLRFLIATTLNDTRWLRQL